MPKKNLSKATALTRIRATALLEPDVAVMDVEPGESAVTTPDVDTLATDGELEVHVGGGMVVTFPIVSRA